MAGREEGRSGQDEKNPDHHAEGDQAPDPGGRSDQRRRTGQADGGQGIGCDQQTDRAGSDGDHQPGDRFRYGDADCRRFQLSGRGRPGCHRRNPSKNRSLSGKSEAPGAGRDHHGSRGPRQDIPAGCHPGDERNRRRGGGDHPGDRRLPCPHQRARHRFPRYAGP